MVLLRTVVVVGAALFLICLAATRAERAAALNGGFHCAEDPNADSIIDIADVTLFTGAFGTNAPELDISPELQPNGIVDISDLTLVLGHFGESCYGTVGTESHEGQALGEAVWSCSFKTWVFFKGTDVHGNYVWITNWGGKTNCSSNVGAHHTECSFNISKWHPVYGWQTVAASPRVHVNGTYCATFGYPASLPLWTTLRGGLQHTVWDGGFITHGPHFHAENYQWQIP